MKNSPTELSTSSVCIRYLAALGEKGRGGQSMQSGTSTARIYARNVALFMHKRKTN